MQDKVTKVEIRNLFWTLFHAYGHPLSKYHSGANPLGKSLWSTSGITRQPHRTYRVWFDAFQGYPEEVPHRPPGRSGFLFKNYLGQVCRGSQNYFFEVFRRTLLGKSFPHRSFSGDGKTTTLSIFPLLPNHCTHHAGAIRAVSARRGLEMDWIPNAIPTHQSKYQWIDSCPMISMFVLSQVSSSVQKRWISCHYLHKPWFLHKSNMLE